MRDRGREICIPIDVAAKVAGVLRHSRLFRLEVVVREVVRKA
jgi:hypothetical protein